MPTREQPAHEPVWRLARRAGHLALASCALSLWTGHAQASKCYERWYPTLVAHSDGARIEGSISDTAESDTGDSATSDSAPIWLVQGGLRLFVGSNYWQFYAIAGPADELQLLSPEPE